MTNPDHHLVAQLEQRNAATAEELRCSRDREKALREQVAQLEEHVRHCEMEVMTAGDAEARKLAASEARVAALEGACRKALDFLVHAAAKSNPTEAGADVGDALLVLDEALAAAVPQPPREEPPLLLATHRLRAALHDERNALLDLADAGKPHDATRLGKLDNALHHLDMLQLVFEGPAVPQGELPPCKTCKGTRVEVEWNGLSNEYGPCRDCEPTPAPQRDIWTLAEAAKAEVDTWPAWKRRAADTALVSKPQRENCEDWPHCPPTCPKPHTYEAPPAGEPTPDPVCLLCVGAFTWVGAAQPNSGCEFSTRPCYGSIYDQSMAKGERLSAFVHDECMAAAQGRLHRVIERARPADEATVLAWSPEYCCDYDDREPLFPDPPLAAQPAPASPPRDESVPPPGDTMAYYRVLPMRWGRSGEITGWYIDVDPPHAPFATREAAIAHCEQHRARILAGYAPTVSREVDEAAVRARVEQEIAEAFVGCGEPWHADFVRSGTYRGRDERPAASGKDGAT
jgi:hypothetical protein